MRVEEVMTRGVVSVPPGTSLRQVAKLLLHHGFSGLPVLGADSRVLGVVSEGDIVAKEQGPREQRVGFLARLARTRSRSVLDDVTAEEGMTSPAVTIEPRMSVWAAAQLMVEHGVDRLPVVKAGELVGIVTRADLVRAFARSDVDIWREITEHVLRSFALEHEVEVVVIDGEVAITGEVPPESAPLLEPAIQRVPGVLRVYSDVRVREPATV